MYLQRRNEINKTRTTKLTDSYDHFILILH
jgi:hypothetical protein